MQNGTSEVPEVLVNQASVISGLGHVHLLDQISFRIEQPGTKIGILGASRYRKITCDDSSDPMVKMYCSIAALKSPFR